MAAMAAGAVAAQGDAAAPRQAMEPVRLAAENFLRREAQGLPGQVAVEVTRADERVSLSDCAQMTAFFPAGSRAWGRTTVGVRCTAPLPWTIYMAARVRITADYLETARPLAAGQQLSAADVVTRHGDLDRLPPGVVTDPAQAIGRKLANGLRAGIPLRADALRDPPAVHQGQLVALRVTGPGFRISSEGHALARASEGKPVQVKTASGTIVSGIVRPGPVVEVVR